MIARMWHGKVPSEKAEAYHSFLKEKGLRDYYIEGNLGVFALKRTEGNITHFYTLTFWDKLETIKKFAGKDYEQAKYYAEDRDFLLEFEPLVTHMEVLEKPDHI